MGDLQPLHTTARALALGLRDGLERLEKATAAGRPDTADLARDLAAKLAELTRTAAALDAAWRMAVVRQPASARDLWKRKVEQVAEEAASLRVALDRVTHRERRRAADAAARADLLAGAPDARAFAADADAEAGALASVRTSKRMLEETLATGAAALVEMSGQRERLKAARTKALDVLHGLGLSDSVLRVIERRQKTDALLAYGGMGVVTLVLVVCWWKFK